MNYDFISLNSSRKRFILSCFNSRLSSLTSYMIPLMSSIHSYCFYLIVFTSPSLEMYLLLLSGLVLIYDCFSSIVGSYSWDSKLSYINYGFWPYFEFISGLYELEREEWSHLAYVLKPTPSIILDDEVDSIF